MKKVTFLFAILTLIAVIASCGSNGVSTEVVNDSTQIEEIIIPADSAEVAPIADSIPTEVATGK
jgi:hypothetical protein